MSSYISFPNIGLELNVDNVAFSVFGKDVYWYGIVIAIGFAIAVFVALYLAKKYGMKAETILDIVIFGAPVAIICARAYYVAFRWEEYYSQHPEDIIKIWNGGIAIYGAIIGAVAVGVIYCRVKKENFRLLVDIGGIGLAIGQCLGRWGNFFNQEAFGGNTTLPWAMTGNKIKSTLYSLKADGINVDPKLGVHPTFLYESLWNFVFIVFALKFFNKRKFDGQMFLFYIIYYGIGRFWIEGLRTDSLYLGSLRISQLVAIACVALGSALMFYMLRKKDKKLTMPVQN